MEYKQSLARRIVIAFMLMTVAVGGDCSPPASSAWSTSSRSA